MKQILFDTAIKMEPLKAYGVIHLTYFIVGVILCVLTGYLLRNKKKKVINIILFIIGLLLLLSEVYKQLFYYYVIGNGTYQWWIFPFQLCSVPMYLCLILPFVKNQKIYNGICSFMFSYNFLGGFIAFLEPSGLIHDYLFLTIHAFLWHMLLVLIGMILALNKNIIKDIKDFKYSFIVFLVLCLIAFIINNIFYNISGGDINMFFIGPNVSPLVVFNLIATKYGWYINTPIYIILVSLGAFAIYLLFYKISRRIK